MKPDVNTAANDPVAPLKDFLRATIEQGFFSRPLDLLPGNLLFCIDPTVEAEVLLSAIEKALKSLADDGFIVDTGRRVTCDICCEEEIVWAKAGSSPAQPA